METVQILMSTYNGEAYLREQLDSIFKQSYPALELLVRDDGSSDGTVKLLNEYAEKYPNMKYYVGANKGAVQSFFDLLKNSSDSAVYYAFADQDDVWLPEKISRAVERFQSSKTELPGLYCSDVYITDENLQVIKADNKNPYPSFGNALVQNICTGCTAVMNRSLRNIVKETSPVHIVMHDWWFYLSATLFGEVFYDNSPSMYYRQHGHNEWGAKTRKLDILKYRIRQLTKKRGYIYRQVEEITKAYEITDQQKQTLIRLVKESEHGFPGKLRLVMNHEIYRNGREDDFVYRAAVLLGKL